MHVFGGSGFNHLASVGEQCSHSKGFVVASCAVLVHAAWATNFVGVLVHAPGRMHRVAKDVVTTKVATVLCR